MLRTIVITFVAWLTALFFSPAVTTSPVVPMKTAQALEYTQTEVTVMTEQMVEQRSPSKQLDIPISRQLPELFNGCEVTSLSMLLHAEGIVVDKMDLAKLVKKDPTPFQGSSLHNIEQWGDPNKGFVGDITGKQKGYGVYNGPIFDLLLHFVPEQAVNLTGRDFSYVEWAVNLGSPVVVWTTINHEPVRQWITWRKGEQEIKATLKEHAVLLVGYDKNHVYINDPLTGEKSKKVPKQYFLASWEQMGRQAVTILDEEHREIYTNK
jgi:uncharacterized protein YvpB